MPGTQGCGEEHRLSAVRSAAQDQGETWRDRKSEEEAEESDGGWTGDAITRLAVGIPRDDQQIRPNDHETQNSRQEFGWAYVGDGRLKLI